MNEVGFERTEYTVPEYAGSLTVTVRLSDINFTQTDDDTLGVEIMVSASTSNGTAKSKKVWLIAVHGDQITCMVIQSNQFTLLSFIYCCDIVLHIVNKDYLYTHYR